MNEWLLINAFPAQLSSPPDVLLNYEFDAELENNQKRRRRTTTTKKTKLSKRKRFHSWSIAQEKHVLLFLRKKTFTKIVQKSFVTKKSFKDMNEFGVIRVLGVSQTTTTSDYFLGKTHNSLLSRFVFK